MRAAIYARYSSDNQREASIDDQVREAKKLIKSQGWKNAQIYFDKAISGATQNRPGFQEMLTDAKAGKFDVLVAEALDRISRDQEHIAGIFKQLSFLGIRIFTSSEGEINELHVGLKGTMNALFLKDLATKIRRGQKGRALQGLSPGSLAYGYKVIKKIGPDGELERGLREIDPLAAAIVRRIYQEYVSGQSGKAIAKRLNAEGVPGPSGGTWSASSINGNKQRRDGILWNEAYTGKLIYNRQNFRKDPSTGKRIPHLNPKSQWLEVDAPSLRIIDDKLWDTARGIKARYGDRPLVMRRRPQRLFSGISKCGVCSCSFTVIGCNRMGCSAHRDRGTCTNNQTISIQQFEKRVLSGLNNALNSADMFSLYEQEFKEAFEVQSSVNLVQNEVWQREREIADLDRKIGVLLSVLETGDQIESVVVRLELLEEQKSDLKRRKPQQPMALPQLPEDIGAIFARQISDLTATLNADDQTRQEALPILRQVFSEIRLHPGEGRGNMAIEVETLPHMAWLASQGADTNVMLTAVSLEGLEPPTPGL